MDGVFATGSVSSFRGANGVLQKVLDLVLGTEVAAEVIATAADVDDTLSNTPVGKGMVKVDYTISAVAYEAYDDGIGNITGSLITVGTINYSTGKIDITFSSAPTGNVTCDYLYGEEGADWRALMEENTKDKTTGEPFGSDCKQVILQNTGISGREQILIGIREWYYAAGAGYGWDLNGYREYSSGMLWGANGTQVGSTSYNTTWNKWAYLPMVPMIDDTMYYWIYSDSNRIIVVIKVSSNYESCYLGHGRRFGSPAEYPTPLVVSGSSTYTYISSSTDTLRRCAFQNSGDAQLFGTLIIINPEGNYSSVWNDEPYQNGPKLLPMNDKGSLTTPTFSPAGCVISSPCFIVDGNHNDFYADQRCLMDLYGVYALACDGVQSEDTVIIDGDRCRVFQNVHRVTAYDFFAVPEVEQTTTTTTTSTTTTTTT